MKPKLSLVVFSIAILFHVQSSLIAEEVITAKSFADVDGKLDSQRAALYITFRDKEPLSKFFTPSQTTLDMGKVTDALGDKLDDLQSKTHHGPPWTWQELDAAYPPKATNAKSEDNIDSWTKISGFTKKKEFKKDQKIESLGPIMLRKNVDELTKSTTDSKGATLAYSKNQLKSGDGALNSEGILSYPTMWNLYQGGSSAELGFNLASQWKVAQVQDNPKKDVNELTFTTPLTLYLSPGWVSKSPSKEEMEKKETRSSSALWIFQSNPYYQTDFDWQHEIYGIDGTVEYVGNICGNSALHLGGFQNLGKSGLQYQIRLLPKVDYSVTERGGVYTTRKAGDDWLRLGGTGSLDFRLGLKDLNALDAGVSYQFFGTIHGSGGYVSLFKAHTTLWLIENVGATFEYSNGDTPIADQPIDLLTFGLEFKY